MTKSDIQRIIDSITSQKIPVTTLADDDSPCVVSAFFSTGCYVLDAVLGGGLPLGRIVEIYGDTSTGKSLIAAQACATCQEDGGLAFYIDSETAVSLPIMEAVGVDVDQLIYTAPDTVEQVFSVMEGAIDAAGDRDLLIVWDSIAATSAEAEMGKSTGDTGYLTHARVISQGLRKFARLIARQQVACLFLNQAKENIGVMFGDKVATFGGKSVGFHASIRVMLKVGSKIKSKKKSVVGVNVRARVTKNKIAPPFRECTLPIYFGYGIDEDAAALEFLKEAGYIKYSGGYYTWEDHKFRKSEWTDVYSAAYSRVNAYIDEAASGMDLI